jgi:hypothetical protein
VRVNLLQILVGLSFFVSMGYGADTPTPSPTCNPSDFDTQWETSLESNVYKPDVPFTVRIQPVNEDDWPTTPLGFHWRTNITDPDSFWSDQSIELTVTPPGPDTILIASTIQGYGIRPECPNWTIMENLFINRFDYVPTPTPTPIPPTSTPYCTPHEFSCIDGIISPVHLSIYNPTTVVLEHGGVEFLGLETLGGIPVPVTHIEGNKYLSEDLNYNSIYVWYFIGDYYSTNPANIILASRWLYIYL